jgi:hypothetical protein
VIGDRDELERAIASYRASLRDTPSASPDYAVTTSNLAQGLQSRYTLDGAPGDLSEGIELYRASCHDGARSRPGTFIGVSRRWAGWALQRAAWVEAVEALGYARSCIREVLRSQVLRAHSESWLREADGLAATATAAWAALRVSDPRGAVTALEEGRVVLLLRERADLLRLAAGGHDSLVAAYRAAAARLNAVGGSGAAPNPDHDAYTSPPRAEVV